MQAFRCVAIGLLSLWLWLGWGTPVLAIDNLEEQVLQIIRDNPEVIIESVQTYQQQQQQAQQQSQQAVLQQLKPKALIGTSPTLGPQRSANVLVEFSDFQCPFCAQTATDIKPFLQQHPNQVTFAYKHLPIQAIHDQAMPAAQASWAAQQQGKFWPYHDALFARQSELGNPLYIEIAQQLQLDIKQFERDRNSDAAVKAINADLALAQKIDIPGTPFFILNGQVLSSPFDAADTAAMLVSR
ncbi:thioredoxin domain-containing protein [Acaryochloris sp. IP29b_bin.148]|uniref:DsbA family protein n=1 Tax=Acaryochloris sp. IP29b_bin.148 TaxID=2969218 RepID=UPI00260D6535|nr:thioredoxin domain-containing protein [Acaryochloris sp. IP29b_bin.148]